MVTPSPEYQVQASDLRICLQIHTSSILHMVTLTAEVLNLWVMSSLANLYLQNKYLHYDPYKSKITIMR